MTNKSKAQREQERFERITESMKGVAESLREQNEQEKVDDFETTLGEQIIAECDLAEGFDGYDWNL